MRCYNGWSYRPYAPVTDLNDSRPYICMLQPGETSLRFEWFDDTLTQPYTAHIKPLTGPETRTQPVNDSTGVIYGLAPGGEYKFWITRADGTSSNVRRVRIGFIPGTVINYLHPSDTQYAFSGSFLCSPSLVRLPSGALLASSDVYGHATPQNLTLIYRSDDEGKTWRYVTDIMPCFWGRLFLHRGILYMLGISNEYGDALIGRSDDEGRTWSTPTVLLRGSANSSERGCHRAPMHFISCAGRLWTALEYGAWRKESFSVGALSVAEDADLLDVNNWCVTGFADLDTTALIGDGNFHGMIEGNLAIAPDGSLVSLMRCAENTALLFRYDKNDPDAKPEFVQTVELPTAHSKFEIHARDGIYYCVGNRLPLRNILSLYTSEDLIHWTFIRDIENREDEDKDKVAFQYPTWLFDGDGIALVSRTAYNDANNFHDANCITYYHIPL